MIVYRPTVTFSGGHHSTSLLTCFGQHYLTLLIGNGSLTRAKTGSVQCFSTALPPARAAVYTIPSVLSITELNKVGENAIH